MAKNKWVPSLKLTANAHENPIFLGFLPSKWHGGFSMAMLVYRRVGVITLMYNWLGGTPAHMDGEMTSKTSKFLGFSQKNLGAWFLLPLETLLGRPD